MVGRSADMKHLHMHRTALHVSQHTAYRRLVHVSAYVSLCLAAKSNTRPKAEHLGQHLHSISTRPTREQQYSIVDASMNRQELA